MIKRHYFTALALASLISTVVIAAEQPNNSIPSTTPPPALTTPPTTTNTMTTTSSATLSEADKLSYSLGIQMGADFKQQNLQINPTVYMQGVTDGQQTGPKLLTEEEVKNTLITFQKNMIQKQQETQMKLSATNLDEGTKYLEANKKKPGWTTLPSGLQYRVIQTGTGPKPTATDTVTTHYIGRFIDGKEFDSSYSRGEPAQFQVNSVIPGWSEALQLMQPGAKWEIALPPTLAYGENNVGRIIGPNSTLIFNIELLSIAGLNKPITNTNNSNKTTPKNMSQKPVSKTTPQRNIKKT